MKQLPGIEGYPLSWPAGWIRTDQAKRKKSRYELSFAEARDEVLRSLRLLGATEAVISSNVPRRNDGLPSADYSEPRDSWCAVYWLQPTGKPGEAAPKVMACDCWRTVRENLRAIGLALEAMRALERSGASQIFERAFTGFAALPPSTKRHWRQVLGFNSSGPVTRESIDASYRGFAIVRHPDVPSGSHEAMAELNAAKAEAYKELGL